MLPLPLTTRQSADDLPPFCRPTPLDSTIMAFVFLSAALSWWIWELPSLFRHGFGEFAHRVCWQILRVHSPSDVGHFALTRRANPADWAGFYYFGAHHLPPRIGSVDTRRDGGWQVGLRQWAMIALYELPTLVAAILCAYRWSDMHPEHRLYRPLLGDWIAGCLPPMVVGAALLLTSRLAPGGQTPASRFLIVKVSGIAFLALVVVGTAYALAIYFGPPRSDPDVATQPSELMYTAVWYGLVMTPFTLIPGVRRNVWLRIPTLAPAVLGRAWGMLAGLKEWGWTRHDCTLQPDKLRGAAAAFAALALIMGVFGFGVYRTVGEKRDTRSAGGSAPNSGGLTGTAGWGFISLESHGGLSVPEHTYTPMHSTGVPRPSSDHTPLQSAAQEMASDLEEPLDPPPPYTPSRAPTYVEDR